jgi:hypothetical protein
MVTAFVVLRIEFNLPSFLGNVLYGTLLYLLIVMAVRHVAMAPGVLVLSRLPTGGIRLHLFVLGAAVIASVSSRRCASALTRSPCYSELSHILLTGRSLVDSSSVLLCVLGLVFLAALGRLFMARLVRMCFLCSNCSSACRWEGKRARWAGSIIYLHSRVTAAVTTSFLCRPARCRRPQ